MSVTHAAVRTMVAMAEGHNSNPAFQPVVQVVSIKVINSTPTERYRTILSDGEHFVNGMLATQLNHLVQSNQMRTNCLIQVEEFMNNLVQGKTVIILLKFRIVGYQDQRLGSPVDVSNSGVVGASGVGVAPVTATGLGAQPMYNRTNRVDPAMSYHGATNNNMASASYKPPTTTAAAAAAGANNPYGRAGGHSTTSPVKSMYGNSNTPAAAPIVRTSATTTQHYTPISSLNMYQNRWTIRARLTSKSDIRTWSNAKGEGSLFSVELLDSSDIDIRGTFFKEAVDKFYNMLEVGKVYTFSGGRLKVASMQYNTCKSNFEITFDQNAEIHLDNDVGDIQEQVYEFVKIANLDQFEANKFVDVLAIVKHVSEPATLLSKKSGQELTKCDLTLVDDSEVEVNMTVWGEKAHRAPTDYASQPVVAFRRARVSDYGGKTLSASGPIVVLPNVPQAFPLQEWWKAVGSKMGSSKSLSSTGGGGGGKMDSLAERKDISCIKNENLGYGSPDKPDWISFKATITFLKKDKEGGAWYTACPNDKEPCRNRYKVTQTTEGQWYCEKCQGTYPTCVRRWIFSGTVADDTSCTWISLFNEQAEVLLQATADDVYAATTADSGSGGGGDQDKYDSYFAKATNTEWIFKCKVKNEMMGDESRVKTTAYSLLPVDYLKESRDLLAAIAKF